MDLINSCCIFMRLGVWLICRIGFLLFFLYGVFSSSASATGDANMWGMYTDKMINSDDEYQSSDEYRKEFKLRILQGVPAIIAVPVLFICSVLVGYYLGLCFDRIFYCAEYVKNKVARNVKRVFIRSSRALEHVSIPR